MRGRAHRTVGLTLIETTLVVATIALLVGLALPAVRAMVDSFQSEGGTKSIIQATLNSARTMAVTRQRYVGVRFQKACISNDPCNPLAGELNAPQYMIFIVHEEPKVLNLSNGFRALEGHEPIKLPDTIGVMELDKTRNYPRVASKMTGGLSGATTFSIVFSPAGKLVVHDVRVRNRHGVYQPRNDPGSKKVSHDDVFNSVDNICRYREGMFLQDDYSISPGGDTLELGLGQEASVTSFVIYDRATFRRLSEPQGVSAQMELRRYLDSLLDGKSVHVSPYTGNLISSD